MILLENYLSLGSLSKEQKYFMLVIVGLFLPFYFTITIMFLYCCFMLFRGKLHHFYLNKKTNLLILPFVLINGAVSYYFDNQLGLLCSIGILIIFSTVICYREITNRSFFETIISFIVFMSIPCAIYGLMEYNGILKSLGFETFEIMILDQPQHRLNSVFFNANYYATMIEFFCLMAYYRLVSNKNFKGRIYYAAVILLNLFTLYLTACRTAWPSLGIGVFVISLWSRDKKVITTVFIVGFISAILFFTIPNLFPRSSNIADYYNSRQLIWDISFSNILKHPLFGQGPLTYNQIWSLYPGGFETQHAHSIYIDPFLSHGILGVVIIAPYFIYLGKELLKDLFVKKSILSDGLILGVIATILCHGLLDYTVFFVQTGFVFLMMINSYHSVLNKETDSLHSF